MFEKFISERLAQLRLQKGVSARDMSLTLGQSDNYINTIENKKSLPSMTAFLYICEYLGVTPKDFFDDGTSNPTLVNDIVSELKHLNNKALEHMLEFLRETNKR